MQFVDQRIALRMFVLIVHGGMISGWPNPRNCKCPELHVVCATGRGRASGASDIREGGPHCPLGTQRAEWRKTMGHKGHVRMTWLGRIFAIGLILGLAACAPSKFKTYSGPQVTQVVVNKGARQMLLLHGNTLLKAYRIGLGNEPIGHKQFEGDGRTPEGTYTIDRRNPDSLFHLAIGISYPNEADVAFATAQGQPPGGDIFIHGGPRRGIDPMNVRDWTAGCIAVSDAEMQEIWAATATGTEVEIRP